jgi:hypothetical protein
MREIYLLSLLIPGYYSNEFSSVNTSYERYVVSHKEASSIFSVYRVYSVRLDNILM